ncbi:MAG: electron transfer flavoprotein subunit beta/FixA family protein [Spirochaetes bacterium]|nr:electron transfer flavoprotein subunit beta/FixA family protein [Spirochaetota bacterium]
MKRIVVCLKQVPSTASVGFDPKTNNLDRSGAAVMTNPADGFALEAALALKDRTGCEVAALTMGRPEAASLLREAAECGATSLWLITDPAFAGSDSYATAFILARAIKAIGGADLVLCGRRALDGETGQTGPELAAMLSIPSVTNLVGIELSAEENLICQRLRESCLESLAVKLPALLSVCEGMPRLRPPSILAMRRSRSMEIRHLDSRILGLDPSRLGAAGSFTRVDKLSQPPSRDRSCELVHGEANGATRACEALLTILGRRG